jgi:hypothetical protein
METELERTSTSQDAALLEQEKVEQELDRQDEEQRTQYRRKVKEKWSQTPHGRLCIELYEKFVEYAVYLEQHPDARGRPDGREIDFKEHRLFENALFLVDDHIVKREERDRKNLEKARQAARCEHEFTSGERCRAPRLRGKTLCRMHERMKEAEAVKLDLGPLEDPDSIQVAIKKLQKTVIDGTLDHKQIGYLAYLIQLAAWNVTRTSFGMRETTEK